MYVAKAKTVVQAVTIGEDRTGLRPAAMFSLYAAFNTKLQRRLSYVEIAEKSHDWHEYVLLSMARAHYPSIRAAVADGFFDRMSAC
jgi:hypothetical protein